VPVRNLGQDPQYGTNINIKDVERDLMGFSAFLGEQNDGETVVHTGKCRCTAVILTTNQLYFIGDCKA